MLRDSKGTCGKTQERWEHVQTGMDVEVGGLLPTFAENRGVHSERRREKEKANPWSQAGSQTWRVQGL